MSCWYIKIFIDQFWHIKIRTWLRGLGKLNKTINLVSQHWIIHFFLFYCPKLRSQVSQKPVLAFRGGLLIPKELTIRNKLFSDSFSVIPSSSFLFSASIRVTRLDKVSKHQQSLNETDVNCLWWLPTWEFKVEINICDYSTLKSWTVLKCFMSWGSPKGKHFFAPYLHRVNLCKSNFSCSENKCSKRKRPFH